VREGCGTGAPSLVLIMLSHAPSFRGRVRPAACGNVPPVRGGEAPTGAGAERRTRWLSLTAKPVPPAGGNSRPHNAGRRAYRRLTAAFSFVLGTAFWKRKGAAIAKLLDPAGFFAPAFIRSTSPLPDGPT
jgi:hypothetical protein